MPCFCFAPPPPPPSLSLSLCVCVSVSLTCHSNATAQSAKTNSATKQNKSQVVLSDLPDEMWFCMLSFLRRQDIGARLAYGVRGGAPKWNLPHSFCT